MNQPTNKRSHARRLIAGWCGLLLYVGAFSPVGVGLVGVIGACDPDHKALVQANAGGIKVVLHHAQKCFSHHHGLLARTLTLFAEPVRASQPDHVLQFSTGETAARPQQFLAPAPTNVAQPEFSVSELPLAFILETLPACVPIYQPPQACGQLLDVRSTVLLI